MNTYNIKHINLSANEIMFFVPKSLAWDDDTFKMSGELMEKGFTVHMNLNGNGELLYNTDNGNEIVCFHEDEDYKEYGMVISQKTSDIRREVIKKVVEDFKSDKIKFVMLVEEDCCNRTWITEI